MSFFKNLLGGTFESNREDGESLLREHRLGEAKLAFERALARSKGISAADLQAVEKKVRKCKLELAHARIASADEEARTGDLKRALEILDDAKDISSEPEILEAIKERRIKYESDDARQLVDDSEEISEEELLAIIAGTWTEAQAEEYAAMPDEFRAALLADHDGEPERAAKQVTEILAGDELEVPPVFAWLELGRMRLRAKDIAGAIEALDSFLSAVPDEDETVEARIAAHSLRANAFAGLKRFDEAKKELADTTRLAPKDHTTFLALGVFLRSTGDHEGALKALERAAELMGQMQPDFKVVREMGFTYLAMGEKDDAFERLNAVIEHLASRGDHDQFDPETAIAVAQIHEAKGRHMEAADLFRHLAVGYDTKNHYLYNLEAARLLKLAHAQNTLIERYLTRAFELAQSDEQKGIVEKMRSSTKS